MGHARPGRGTGEGGAAGIPEQVKHPDRPAGSPDEDGHPLPVDGLFREQAGMLEAHGFETEPQPRKTQLRSVVSDLPHVGQRAQPFPMAAARPRAVITGMSFLPERVGPGGIPQDLRVGADEEDLPPPLQTLTGRAVNQLVILPTI